MATSGTPIDEVIPCGTSGSGVALDRLLAAVAAGGEYHAVQVAPDRLQFARSFRPTWAIVAGCCTIWIGGLGALFFLVKTTETCLAVIESDHRGTRIRLSGRMSAAALGRIRTALSSTEGVGASEQVAPTPASGYAHGAPPAVGQPTMAATSSPVSPSPVQQIIDLAAAPVPPAAPVGIPVATPAPAWPAAAVAPAAPPVAPAAPPVAMPFTVGVQSSAPHPPPYVADAQSLGSADGLRIPDQPGRVTPAQTESPLLHDPAADPDATITPARRSNGTPIPVAVVDDGQRVALSTCTLIGRGPVAGPTDTAPLLVALEDTTMSVSKTHLAIIYDGTGWFAEDRYSTNGVEMVRADGTVVRLQPGVRMPVAVGATLRFGERSVRFQVDHR